MNTTELYYVPVFCIVAWRPLESMEGEDGGL